MRIQSTCLIRITLYLIRVSTIHSIIPLRNIFSARVEMPWHWNNNGFRVQLGWQSRGNSGGKTWEAHVGEYRIPKNLPLCWHNIVFIASIRLTKYSGHSGWRSKQKDFCNSTKLFVPNGMRHYHDTRKRQSPIDDRIFTQYISMIYQRHFRCTVGVSRGSRNWSGAWKQFIKDNVEILTTLPKRTFPPTKNTYPNIIQFIQLEYLSISTYICGRDIKWSRSTWNPFKTIRCATHYTNHGRHPLW